MKEEVEQALRPLIGNPLSDMTRFGGIQIFEFGVQRPRKNRKGQEITVADQKIHVSSCEWRISGPEGEIVGSKDFTPVRGDERAHPFYQMLGDNPPLVQTVEADKAGGFVLQMIGGYSLTVSVDENIKEPDIEQWRFLPKAKSQNHFVIYSTETGNRRYTA